MELLFKGKQLAAGQNYISSNTVGSLKEILNSIIQRSPTEGLIVICLFIVVTTALKNLFLYLSYYISSPIRTATITQLRSELYEKILKLPIGYFTERRKGDLISRMTNDIYEIESSVVATLEGLIKNPLTILGYLFYMVYLSPRLSLFLIILLPVTAFFIGRISRSLKKQSQAAAERLGESLSVLDETVSGIRVIKGFNAESLLRNKFFGINDLLFNIRNKMNARRDLASPLTEVLGVIVLSTILYIGGRLVLTNDVNALPAGDLMTYIAVFAIMINPAKDLSTAFFNMQRGAAAMERVEELLKAPVTIEENPKMENHLLPLMIRLNSIM